MGESVDQEVDGAGIEAVHADEQCGFRRLGEPVIIPEPGLDFVADKFQLVHGRAVFHADHPFDAPVRHAREIGHGRI